MFTAYTGRYWLKILNNLIIWSLLVMLICVGTSCYKSFTRAGSLRSHERIHIGEKPYSCSSCEKSFTEVGNMKKHERIHNGERQYSCRSCDKSFTAAHHLKTHKRIHNVEKLTIYGPLHLQNQ